MKTKLFDYHIQTLEHGLDRSLRIEETIESAIKRGLSAISLTDHFPLPPDFPDPTEEKDCAMKWSLYAEYRKLTKAAQEKYKDRIGITFGAEFDWLPDYSKWIKKQLSFYPFDYVIGSVHFLGKINDEKGERNFVLDYTKEEFLRGLRFFKNIKNLANAYYKNINDMVKSGLFDCVGHIDLIKKYNYGSLFSEDEEWYTNLVSSVLDSIASSEMLIEINTSGFDKECKMQYPSLWILKEAKRRNIGLTMGSDAHTPDRVGRNLGRAVDLAKKAGYQKLSRFVNREKLEVKI